jgi:hypothetical protein
MLVGSAYGKVGLDTSGVVTGVQQAVDTLKKFQSSMELLGGGLKKLQNNFDTAKAAVAAARSELERMKTSAATATQPAAENLHKLEQAAKAARQAVVIAREELQKVRAAGGDVKPASDNLKKAQENAKAAALAVKNAREELEKIKSAGASGVKSAADNLRNLEANAEAAGKALHTAEGQIGQLREAGTKLGQTLQDIGGKLTVGVTLPLLALGAASIKVASDFDETANKANVVFGDMAESVRKNAEKADTALGLSAKKYLDYSSSIAAALKAGGMSVAESASLSEQAVKHFADLASFHNAQVEDVAAAWQSAIRGQYEPIQKYFPFITDAYLKTYGTAKKLISATTENLTANQRAIILNAIALDEQLNPAINDFAETSGGLANQTRIAQAQFENLLRTLGQNLLPIALQMATALNSLLEKFNNMGPAQQKIALGFLAMIAALGPVLSFLGTLVGIVTQLSMLFGAGGALATAGPAISGAFTAISAAVTGTAIPALGALAAAAAPVLAVIAVFLPALALLYWAFSTNFMGISDTVRMGWEIIKFYFKQGINYLGETLRMLGVILKVKFQQTFQNVVTWFKTINWSAVGQNISQGIALGIVKGVVWIIDAAKKAAMAAYNAAKQALGIRSPSTKMGYLGRMSGLGYVNQFTQAVNPHAIARTMTRTVNTSQTAIQNQTYNFGGGVSIREARRMQKDAEKAALNRMVALLGA